MKRAAADANRLCSRRRQGRKQSCSWTAHSGLLRSPEQPQPHPGAGALLRYPDDAPLQLVLRQMAQDGDLVPWLGSRLAERGTESGEDPRLPPNAEDLAEGLAKLARTTFPRLDLPQVAQYVRMIRGAPGLLPVAAADPHGRLRTGASTPVSAPAFRRRSNRSA